MAPARGKSPLFSVEGIRKSVRNLLIFSDISFEVHEGELLGLVGPSGIARDADIDIVDSILRPDAGVVRFKGEDVTGIKLHKLAAKGLVRTFQKPVVFDDMTVLDNVVVAHHLDFKLPWWRTVMRNDRDTLRATESACEVLKSLGILPLKDLKTKDLRYEQKRTLGIAMALAPRPAMIILDQPPTDLSVNEINLIKGLASEIKSRDITVLMVGSTLTVLEGTCDRIVSMSAGGSSPTEFSWDDDFVPSHRGSDSSQ